MSGHSKWSTIKHKKALADKARGKSFSKVIREITVAARMGGGDPEANPRLRLAIAKAREANMPKDTTEKAIKRGTGDLPGIVYEEMIMEGYGPGGVAILVEALSDNKNRTTAQIRSLLTRNGGSMAGAGSVSWLFTKKGIINLAAKGINEDQLMEVALEAGADDLQIDGDQAVISTTMQTFEAVKQALEKNQMKWESAELTMVPSTTVRIDDPGQLKTLLSLLDSLEDDDDTQHVHANFDIPDELLAEQESA